MKKRIKLIILVFIIIGSIAIGATYGRYVYQDIRNFYLATKNFYFNSDKLKETMARYQIDNWSGVDSFNIIINMNSLKNNKVKATSDIEYNIKHECSDNISCVVSKESGVIFSNTNTDQFIITVTPKRTLNEGEVVTVYVETNSTSPYTKKLSGFFSLKIGIPGLSYEIVDSKDSPYLKLDITNTLDYYKVKESFLDYQVGDKIDINTYLSLSPENQNKCASAIITLEFDPSIVPLDMTTNAYLRAISYETKVIDEYDYINKFSFKLDALSSEVVIFYKKNFKENYTYPFETNTSIIDVSYEI
jgi:hypothetical protein